MCFGGFGGWSRSNNPLYGHKYCLYCQVTFDFDDPLETTVPGKVSTFRFLQLCSMAYFGLCLRARRQVFAASRKCVLSEILWG